MKPALINEWQIRHPWEKTIFIASVVLNLALMVGAIVLVATAHDWLKDHPILLVLAYVIKIPYLRNPMTHVQTLSHDRYGAFLAPGGIRGLVIEACGRRMIQNVNLEDYLRQVREYGGFWERLANMTKGRPHIAYRIQALLNAGLLRPVPDLNNRRQEAGGRRQEAGSRK
jgi:hypothetical protein